MSMSDWLRRQKTPPAGTDGGSPANPVVDPETGEILNAASAPAPDRPNDTAPEPNIPGERGITSVNRQRSIRARVLKTMALGTVGLVGGAVLLWYYAAQFQRFGEASQANQRQAEARATGDFVVPPLGRVDPPARPPQPGATTTAVVSSTTVAGGGDLFGPAPPMPPSPTAAGPYGPTTYPSATPAQPPAKTPEQLALERKLSGPVLLYQAQGAASPAMPTPLAAVRSTAVSHPGPLPGIPGTVGDASEPAGHPGLAAGLTPTATPTVAARVLPTRRLLLPKGAFIDCTLETAIDSTHEGMVTCIGANDVYSADGKVVLLERGTKYVGERRGEVRRGQRRVYVLWAQARTPTGVVVDLASPGTDELGRAGLEGHVDTHFWERFGAAILISVVDGTLQALAASQQQSTDGHAIVLNPRGSGDVLTEVLRSTIDIPPTVVKNQGDRIQVLVARDIDFRHVYALRTQPDRR